MSKIRERSFWPYPNYRCGVLLEVAIWKHDLSLPSFLQKRGEAF